jgi:hypothetical protein
MLALLFGGFEILLLLGGLLFSALFFAFWVWMLIDCVQSKGLSENQKIVWTLVIVFTHALGALIYLLAGRKRAA